MYQIIKEVAPCPVFMIKGLPDDFKTPPNSLLIIDDLQGLVADVVSAWFTKNSHHFQTSVIYLVQNLFGKDAYHRTISLNSNYIVVFRNPRDKSQIMHLAKQAFPGNSHIMVSAYLDATKQPHGYLLADFKQTTSDLYRLRNSVFPHNTSVYVDPQAVGEMCSLATLNI